MADTTLLAHHVYGLVSAYLFCQLSQYQQGGYHNHLCMGNEYADMRAKRVYEFRTPDAQHHIVSWLYGGKYGI